MNSRDHWLASIIKQRALRRKKRIRNPLSSEFFATVRKSTIAAGETLTWYKYLSLREHFPNRSVLCSTSSGGLIGPGLRTQGFRIAIAPAFFSPTGITLTNSPAQNYPRPTIYDLQNSEKYKMSLHHINDNINSFNSINNVWNNCTVADEKSEILAWLSPLEPRIRHQDIQTRRVEGVGDWLLQTQEYRNWLSGIRGGESDGSALFCYGGPGVGKTYIR